MEPNNTLNVHSHGKFLQEVLNEMLFLFGYEEEEGVSVVVMPLFSSGCTMLLYEIALESIDGSNQGQEFGL